MKSLCLHENWITFLGFLNAHDLYIIMTVWQWVSHLCWAAVWWWLIVRKEFYENIIATAAINRPNILLCYTCRSYDDSGTATSFLAIIDSGCLLTAWSCTFLFALTLVLVCSHQTCTPKTTVTFIFIILFTITTYVQYLCNHWGFVAGLSELWTSPLSCVRYSY